MKDKIGICACYATLNYGSMLQAYATQITINNLGYDSEFIVYRKSSSISYKIKQLPRLFNKNLLFDKSIALQKKLALKMHPEIKKKDKCRKEAFLKFSKEYYVKFSKEYIGYEELKKGAKNYDSVVVGSDQLWTPGGLATNFYNLMFVPDNINKVSYATSFGVSQIPWYQKKRTKEYLERINFLSVREIAGAKIIKELTGRDANVVVDPTLLLSLEEWNERIPLKHIVSEKYIFCYFLGKNLKHRDIAKQLQQKTGLKIVCTPYLDSFVKSDKSFGDYQLFDIGPNDFVNLIRGAEYVLTDSFHGSVFSIIYHKKFITLNRFSNGRQSRNSRIDSLCEVLGLSERRQCDDIFTNMDAEIDYTIVDEKLDEIRKSSIEYLRKSLEG